jgi:hypothetical protein
LSEFDIQGILSSTTATASNIYLKKNKSQASNVIGSSSPSGIGLITGFNYRKYILPSNISLKCVHESSSKDSFSLFNICSPIVRVAAFEGFVRICFAEHLAYETKYNLYKQANNSNENPLPTKSTALECTFIAATFEVLNAILKHDTHIWVRQQCALIVADAIQDKPPRIAAQGLSNANYLLTLDWCDTSAITFPIFILNQKSMHGEAHRQAVRTFGRHMQIAVKLLWRIIISTSCFDQVDNI